MKRILTLIALAGMFTSFASATTAIAAGNEQAKMFGIGFTDLDGDGINDNALDADGDGIPNGLDTDFTPPADGSGKRFGSGSANATNVNASTQGTTAKGMAKRAGRQ